MLRHFYYSEEIVFWPKRLCFENIEVGRNSFETRPEGEAYRVQAGDSLWSIAKEEKPKEMPISKATEILAKHNGIDLKTFQPASLLAGRTLFIPDFTKNFEGDKKYVQNVVKEDLTELKTFLIFSNICSKASKVQRQDLANSPVWVMLSTICLGIYLN